MIVMLHFFWTFIFIVATQRERERLHCVIISSDMNVTIIIFMIIMNDTMTKSKKTFSCTFVCRVYGV